VVVGKYKIKVESEELSFKKDEININVGLETKIKKIEEYLEVSGFNIEGRVFSNDDKPLNNVEISLKENITTVSKVLTNSNGIYTFKGVSSGKYKLFAKFEKVNF
jgi:hypothetical protein